MSSSLQVGGRNDGHGWAYYAEGTAITQGTAQQIAADTRTQLLNDATGRVVETQLQTMITPWHDDHLHVELDCFYDVRLTFKAQIASGGAGHHITTELEINGEVGVLWSSIHLFAKGANTEHAYSFTIPVFAGADFVEFGGQFYVITDVATDIWGVDVLVNRTYIPN